MEKIKAMKPLPVKLFAIFRHLPLLRIQHLTFLELVISQKTKFGIMGIIISHVKRLFTYLAKQYLESHYGYLILGPLLSPAHSVTVRERYRTNPSEIIPSPHRLAVAQLLVTNSQWLSIDPWELTRRRAKDY
jgi:hypothetical protein